MDKRRCLLVAVCGSPGSGKSTFTLALGQALSKMKKKTVCISPDPVTPGLAFWLPSMVPAPGITSSLGALLQYTSIDLEAVAGCLIPFPGYRDLAVMGLEYGSYPGKYDMSSKQAVNSVFTILEREVDFLIVDCVTDLRSDLFSHTAFLSADCAVCLLSPDCKGLIWTAMASSQGINTSDTAFVFNQVLSSSPMGSLKDRTGGASLSLPYSDEIPLKMTCGRPLTGFQKKAGRYFEEMIGAFAAKLVSMSGGEVGDDD